MTMAMKASAMNMIWVLVASQLTPTARLEAKARDAVDADVIPEHITVKATMNVKKCTPNAVWT